MCAGSKHSIVKGEHQQARCLPANTLELISARSKPVDTTDSSGIALIRHERYPYGYFSAAGA